MLVSLHTSNETLEKNDFKEAAAGSDDLLGRKAERNQRNREEALSGQLEAFIQNRDGNFWWKWSHGRQRWACYWFSHWDKAREDFLEVIITAARMSVGPLGSTAAPGPQEVEGQSSGEETVQRWRCPQINHWPLTKLSSFTEQVQSSLVVSINILCTDMWLWSHCVWVIL